MATIRTSCPKCGSVDLPPKRITLLVEEGGRRGRYSFPCPKCFARVEKPADKKIIQLMTVAGVATTKAVDTDHPEKPRVGDPITLDDVIDFHQELEEHGVKGFLL